MLICIQVNYNDTCVVATVDLWLYWRKRRR